MKSHWVSWVDINILKIFLFIHPWKLKRGGGDKWDCSRTDNGIEINGVLLLLLLTCKACSLQLSCFTLFTFIL